MRAVDLIRSPSAAISGPGSSDSIELSTTDPEPWQDGDGEHDDPHSAEPLGELAPDAERAVDCVVIGDHARAGRREPGHTLEVRVERARQLVSALEQVGDRGEGRRQEPRQCNDEEPFAYSDPTRRVRRRALERQPEPAGTPRRRMDRTARCTRARRGWGRAPRGRGTCRASRRGSRHPPRRLPAAAGGRSARRAGSTHNASTTHGASAASVKMITRSPASSTSPPCGKTAWPLRTIAPMMDPAPACPGTPSRCSGSTPAS